MQKGKKSKTLLNVVLAVVLVVAAGAIGTVFVVHKKQDKPVYRPAVQIAEKYGYDTVEFGAYPQSRVTDKQLIRALNQLELAWQSFGYYKAAAHAAAEGTDAYMRYADVEYQGNRYRAVTMDFYRDSLFMDNPSDDSDAQALKNHGGYRCKQVYWFRFDPLKWRVLDADTGMLLCECIVDAQPFNNHTWTADEVQNAAQENGEDPYYTAYTDETGEFLANDYAASSIRSWLISAFKETAFAGDEMQKLQHLQQGNESFHTLTGNSGFARMDGMPVQDEITLLSYADAVNPRYNFKENPDQADPAREAAYTDYAVMQGLFLTENGTYGEWMLRTPGYTSSDVCIVGRHPQKGSSFPGFYRNYFHDRDSGSFSVISPYADVKAADLGIRPVIYCPEATVGKANPKSFAPVKAEESVPEQTVRESAEIPRQDDTAAAGEDFMEYEDFTEFEDFTAKVTDAPKTQSTTKAFSAAQTRKRTSRQTATRQTYTAATTTKKTAFTLTVRGDNGVSKVSGGGVYHTGDQVTVTVSLLFGYTFRKWKSSDASLLPDGSAVSYTFAMPAGDVSLTAETYIKPTVTVTAGSGVSSVTGAGAYAIGQTVTVKAEVKSGYVFDSWQSEQEGFGSKQNPYSFTMPEHDVRLIATAKEKTFTVAVKSGTGVSSVSGSGQYKAGDKVTISATVQQDYVFDTWLGYTPDNPLLASTSFRMPASDVAIAATAKKKDGGS